MCSCLVTFVEPRIHWMSSISRRGQSWDEERRADNMQAQRTSSLTAESVFQPPTLSVLRNEASSGVSWAAIAAGAFVAAAFSLVLLALGTGIGLSSISPWSNGGASGPAAPGGAIIWLILVEVIASAAGGYLAGRLRTKWANLHTDEVYFRDTAHGLLVSAVGLVITAAFLASAATTMVGGSTTSAQSAPTFRSQSVCLSESGG